MSEQPDPGTLEQYAAMRQYLGSHLKSQRSNNNVARASAKEKMSLLPRRQLSDLWTDVFDEMNRRQMRSGECN
jgi:hypothetical protein